MTRTTSLAAALPAAFLALGMLSTQTLAQTSATGDVGAQSGAFAHLLKKLDTDGDGKISLAEFQAAASARFKAADTQNSGSITAEQLATSPQAQEHNLRAASMLVRHLDTAHKGYVTQDDFVAAAQTRFARLDTQGTGKLTAAQLAVGPHPGRNGAATSAATGGKHAAAREQLADAEFAKLDTNGDGSVTLDEYVAGAKARFAALDTQGTGKVTAEQIASSSSAQQRDLKFAEHEVKKVGSNGAISQSEYLSAAQARFAKLDKNGDGYITADEFTPQHWAHRKAAADGSAAQ